MTPSEPSFSGSAENNELLAPDRVLPRSGLFPVVGVGASAGGIEAVGDLLAAIQPEAGLAVLVVLHLDPNRVSQLTSILASTSSLPVVLAEDGMLVEPNRVCTIPANQNMKVVGGRIQLEPRAVGLNMPVDVLFRSMAEDLGRRAIGVVLSGGGTDGAMGVTEIKSGDGITFAQDGSARHESMPRSAVATGHVDFVMSPEQIGAELSRMAAHPYLNGEGLPTTIEEENEANLLRKVFDLVRAYSGLDFTSYKRTTIRRRIQRRMALSRRDDLAQYVASLKNEPVEVANLYQDFLIRVTHFFRDPDTYELLKRRVFPPLIRDRTDDSPIRIWVAGCSTGEEVYSLAIALLECLGDMAGNTPIKILATDVNEKYLAVARAGSYLDNISLDVSPERLRRFFNKVDGRYQVSKTVRDLCVFSRHDVSRDTPFAQLDLVSCRNLLIYLDLAAQKRILPLFHYALKPGGHLLLGPSETIGVYGDLFAVVEPDYKVFARRPGPSRTNFQPMPSLPWSESSRAASPERRKAFELFLSPLPRPIEVPIAPFAPACVFIDDQNKLLGVKGPVDQYLTSAQLTVGDDLFEVLPHDLHEIVRTILDEAGENAGIVQRRGVQFGPEGQMRRLDIQVIFTPETVDSACTCCIVFEGRSTRLSSSIEPPWALTLPPGDEANQPRQLEAASLYIQALIEAHDTTTEELRSANEEVLSSNEELRTTNEELQTTKEDMQSANEELQTVNEELSHRNNELARINDDLINLFGSTSIPIVMVSREQNIRRFTAAAERVLNLIPSDIGRPISNIRPNLEFPDLCGHIAEVITSLTPQDHEVQDLEGRWHSLRIRPYVTIDNRIDGAVITIVDIDQMKRAAESLRQAGEYAGAIIETIWHPLMVLDQDLNVLRANKAFFDMFRAARDQTENQPLSEVLGGSRAMTRLVVSLQQSVDQEQVLRDHEIETNDGRVYLVNTRMVAWKTEDGPKILLAIEDITDRKREQEHARLLAREQAARSEAELANRKKDEFLALLAHELRNPLAPILNALLILRTSQVSEADIEWAREIMERQVRHMARLIDDLLDVSRVMQGKIHLRLERVDLARLLNRAVESSRAFIESRSHRLEMNLAAETIVLNADPVRLEQVFVNLLTNAAKYTEDGGVITVSLSRQNNTARVGIRDNGVGLAPESLQKVFELFIQAEDSLARSVGGLGIGLTLVKTLVELHGGFVTAQSEGLGHGSEFIVQLPVMAESRPQSTASPHSSRSVDRPAKLLLVEDNVDSATTLARLLKHWGHEVRVAHDGLQGLQEARTFRPEVVLLDVGLPGMDGYEVASRLRIDPDTADCVLIALTGYGQAEDRRRAMLAGFDHHLVKPVDPDTLRNAIARFRPASEE